MIDTYRALFPEETPMEFQRILVLKVILAFLIQFRTKRSLAIQSATSRETCSIVATGSYES